MVAESDTGYGRSVMRNPVPSIGGQAARETALMRVLYDEHAAALWRYAVRLTGDPARAEDVVQETLLRAIPRSSRTASGRRAPGCSPWPGT